VPKIQQADAARNQSGVFEFAAPHRAVDALLDEVRAALAATQLQVDIR